MYLTFLKSAVTEALNKTFDSNYRNPDFADVPVSIEYPLTRQAYPSVWVTYDDRDSLEIASIDHREYVADSTGYLHEATRWMFSGTFTLTAVALSSLERDNLYDELVRIYAFSRIEQDTTVFRDTIENNDFVAVNLNWDQLRPGGDAAAPGTPWSTEEVIYEKSLSFDCEGEFISDPTTGSMALLSEIIVDATATDPSGATVSMTNVLVNAATEVALGP